jgi:hypothetical protein
MGWLVEQVKGFTEQSFGLILTELLVPTFAAAAWFFREAFKSALVAFRKWLEAKQVKDPLAKQIQSDGLVLEMLETLAEEFAADRSYIIQFSNGNYYESGSHIRKYTMSHEWVSPGISRKSHLLQEKLTSTIPFYLNDVLYNKAQYPKIDEVQSVSLKGLMELHGIKSMIGVPIYSDNGKVIGVFGMEWVRDYAGDFCKEMRPDIYEVFKQRIQEFKIYL